MAPSGCFRVTSTCPSWRSSVQPVRKGPAPASLSVTRAVMLTSLGSSSTSTLLKWSHELEPLPRPATGRGRRRPPTPSRGEALSLRSGNTTPWRGLRPKPKLCESVRLESPVRPRQGAILDAGHCTLLESRPTVTEGRDSDRSWSQMEARPTRPAPALRTLAGSHILSTWFSPLLPSPDGNTGCRPQSVRSREVAK